MGISISTARLLLDWIDEYEISGRSLTLGVQDVNFSEMQLYQAMFEQDMHAFRGQIEFKDNALTIGSKEIMMTREVLKSKSKLYRNDPNPSIQNPAAEMKLHEAAFFEILGFDHQSLDNSDYEGADIIQDLNQDFSVEKSFDFILDFGTSEHVFDFPAVLRNIHNNLNAAGYIFHFCPSHNFVDHGFYTVSPCLFYEYYEANHYDILKSYFVKLDLLELDTPYMMQAYKPGIFGVEVGQFDENCYATAMLVRKTESSSSDVIPQQGRYKKHW